jgi:hypothetical protein
MIIRAGAAHDPKGKHGLAMMTATLLDRGAATPRSRSPRKSTSSAARSAPAPAPISASSTPS